MLNKGLRDEESIRIDNMLKTLLSIVFVPKMFTEEGKINIEKQLGILDLNNQNLIEMDSNELLERLIYRRLDWNNLEQFADFLIGFSKTLGMQHPNLPEKAIAIYNYIQQESKTFSFGISNKITLAKANL